MAPGHISVFLFQKPSTKHGINRPAIFFLAWITSVDTHISTAARVPLSFQAASSSHGPVSAMAHYGHRCCELHALQCLRRMAHYLHARHSTCSVMHSREVVCMTLFTPTAVLVSKVTHARGNAVHEPFAGVVLCRQGQFAYKALNNKDTLHIKH